MKRVEKSEKEWEKILRPEEFKTMRKCGTDPPFVGKYVHNKEDGSYVCAACGNKLFSSDTKYDSNSGWPSFYKPASKESVETRPDNSLLMHSTEVLCKKCGGHLGHVFDDGPRPTGLRFCINSSATHFKKKMVKLKRKY